MSDPQKTVFISYRRNVSSFIARAIFQDLRAHAYDVFMDTESIDSGVFDTIILNQIAARAHFVLVLTSGTLDRCDEPGDWLRREIEHAMQLQRNIVPVLVNDFRFDQQAQYLSGKLEQLPRYNALNVPHEYFEEAMNRLRSRFLKQPVSGTIQPTPKHEEIAVQQKIDEANSQPPPTEAELTAEALLLRGFQQHENGDYPSAIASYDESLRRNPQSGLAHYNRGISRYCLGDFNGAIDDFTQAILLSPERVDTYINLSLVYNHQGRYDAAINACNQAIRVAPMSGASAAAYNNRGVARYHKHLYKQALDDINKALQIDPALADAYDSRGQIYFALGRYEHALADFNKVNELQPGATWAIGGLAITRHAMGHTAEAKRLWHILVALDENYRDAAWSGKQLDWDTPLINEAQKLIELL
ncbi:MAG: tetratricopeptide repeat protein [Anaerolineae bacterium]|nr:tetratricopeptide repeat protein [Anaerolineae bacterium]